MTSFGLSEQEFQILKNLALEPLKGAGCTVWIFGSRAKGHFQKFSDVDLLFKAPRGLKPGFIFQITSSLEESDFPYKVDLVNIDDLAASYKEDVLKSRILIGS